MDDELDEEPDPDAEDIVFGQLILDDENYDEVVILDLRTPDLRDSW